jgi:large subunit ribosomal protein L29
MPAKNILRSSDIREMSVADVSAKIAELEEERFRLNFRSATEPLEDPLRLRWIRKDIARLKTILRERTLESAR